MVLTGSAGNWLVIRFFWLISKCGNAGLEMTNRKAFKFNFAILGQKVYLVFTYFFINFQQFSEILAKKI